MKSKKFIAALVAATVATSVALVGCGSSAGNKTDGGSAASAGPDKEQYLNISLKQEPKTLDLSKATDLYASYVFVQTMEGLTRVEMDKDGKEVIKPAGAESWTKSDDGLTWTFKLRDNSWSDGQKVTAKDYVYSILRTLDPKTAAQYAYFLDPIKGAKEYNSGKGAADAVGVKAIDDKTLEFKLNYPCAYFLDITHFRAMLPQRQDIVEKNGEKYGTEGNTMVYNGPFVIKDWVHQNKVDLEKNDKYWDAKSVKLSKATLKIIKEENARYNELFNGSLDLLTGVRKDEWIQKYQKEGKYDNLSGFDGGVVYQHYNTKEKLFSNVKVRKAFSIALNREDINKTLYKNLGIGAYAWIPNGINIGEDEYRAKANYLPVKNMMEQNKDPKALLIEGLKELGMDPDPAKVDVTYLSSGTDAQSKEISEYYQQAYEKALGIKMKIEYVEWPVFQKRTDDMQYQFCGVAWGQDYNDPMTFMDMWLSNANIVMTGWGSKDYDALIDKARNTVDQKQRLDIFKQAEKMLIEDEAVVTPIEFRKYNTFKFKYVKGTQCIDFGNIIDIKTAYTEGRGK